MKHLIVILLALPIMAEAQVHKTTDEFTGESTYKSTSPRAVTVEDGDAMRAMYMPIYSEEVWVVAFYLVGDGSLIEYGTDTIYYLVDGERISKKIEQRDSDYKSGKIVYSIANSFSEDEFKKIGDATVVRAKAGRNVLEISYDKRYDMRQMYLQVTDNGNDGEN